jgi:carbamoyl-phosphate synthase large subunit
MSGQSLDDLGIDEIVQPTTFRAVKEAVFPFVKFRGVDPLLSPEMKSTGEVMGIATGFAAAFSKAQLGGGLRLPEAGTAFVSVRDADKHGVVKLARLLVDSGFKLLSTSGTYAVLEEAGIAVEKVAKVTDGARPHIVDHLLNDEVDLIVNTTEGLQAIKDSKSIRQATLERGIAYFTTLAGGLAAAEAIAGHSDVTAVKSIQEYHKG